MLQKTTTSIKTDELLAPDFAVETVDGDRLRLAEFRQRRHVILVFNRGFT